MTEAQVPRQPDAFALWREAQDTRIRSPLGGIYYLLAWLLTWMFSDAPGALVLPGVVGIALFALLLALRVLHRLPQEQSNEALSRWLNLHWSLILITALGWGLAHALAQHNPLFSSSVIIATLSTIAFSTALVFNFAMRKKRAMLALLLIYLPGLLTLALTWREQYAILITLSFYLSYLLLVLNRSHREYHNTLAMELQLLDQQERLEHLSRTDSLTQLGNRYQFNSLFPVMVANAQRQSQPLSLVLLDIDFFKRINDEYGHACGDSCLSDFAERMRQNFRRDSDALLRLGGEEFGILMPNTPLEQARLLAEQFRLELEREGFNVPGAILPLTASLGVGCYDMLRDGSAEAFFKRVDDALYQAKAAGRNRLELA
ncbi:Diguanylate cyclase (GGDEF) domain-containing protein [Pseudomonas sp. 8BK]|uniref:GGDEF domain-containing protein n=1 Tax=Pseudomonas sp. 8BK TaxID=2653164 RepID=UPI0012EEED72|nr:GGDEF domain-containing protein [Pseudomonas sp. 8BK]VXC52621.1 Diguanylate cyclase (GGDEF) domain-containing protein [Pseudomonas sp. 8BK]